MAILQTAFIIDNAHIAEILEAAEKFLRQHHDHKLIQQVTILRGYWELMEMYPARAEAYRSHVRTALDDLTKAIHFQIGRQEAVHVERRGYAKSVYPGSLKR
jgi:hypothetical protein